MQRAQAQRRNPEQSVVSNWNGTVELPVYNFGEEVLQEGSFGEYSEILLDTAHTTKHKYQEHDALHVQLYKPEAVV